MYIKDSSSPMNGWRSYWFHVGLGTAQSQFPSIPRLLVPLIILNQPPSPQYVPPREKERGREHKMSQKTRDNIGEQHTYTYTCMVLKIEGK